GEFPLPLRLGNVLLSYARYLGKIVWPARLAPLYPRPVSLLPEWQLLALMALLLLISAVVLGWCHLRYLPFGWFWFLGTLVPMIGLVTVGEQAMADRFAYIAYIGLFVAAVFSLNAWGLGAEASQYRIRGAWLGGAAVLAILILGCLTHRQLGYWSNDETLWRYTLSVTERNYMAHDNLALALAKQGRSDEAVVEFRAANALHKYPPEQVLALAAYELGVGHPREAAEECDSVLRGSTDPQIRAVASSELGRARLQLVAAAAISPAETPS